MSKTLTILPKTIGKGQYNWNPKNMQEAKALIDHLQGAIENKDKRLLSLIKMNEALELENDLLMDRVYSFKKFLNDIGLKTV